MQSLDIISVNIWQCLISLANLLILYLIIRRFLYKPVVKMLEKRNGEINEKYEDAENMRREAEKSESLWRLKMSQAKADADLILKKASEDAEGRKEKIISDARDKADGILKSAQSGAELEYKKAQSELKKEIGDISTDIAGKVLGREITAEDHKRLIDSFIDEIGDGDDGSDN